MDDINLPATTIKKITNPDYPGKPYTKIFNQSGYIIKYSDKKTSTQLEILPYQNFTTDKKMFWLYNTDSSAYEIPITYMDKAQLFFLSNIFSEIFTDLTLRNGMAFVLRPPDDDSIKEAVLYTDANDRLIIESYNNMRLLRNGVISMELSVDNIIMSVPLFYRNSGIATILNGDTFVRITMPIEMPNVEYIVIATGQEPIAQQAIFITNKSTTQFDLNVPIAVAANTKHAYMVVDN